MSMQQSPAPAGGASARRFFPLVDALRAFAALTVLVYHLIAHWDWTGFPETGPLAWFRGGWMAVDVFFVLSGFVIGLSAFSRLASQPEGFRGAFLRSRLARIAPLHYLTLAVFLVLVEPSLWIRGDIAGNLATHLLFIHNLFLPFHGAINGPNWSLGTEMQFYLLVLLAAPWLARARPWMVALVFVGIAWGWRWGTWLQTIPGPLDQAYAAQTQLPGMLDEFAVGLLLARCIRAPAGQRLLARLGATAWLRCMLFALVALGWWGVLGLHATHDYWQAGAMAVFFRTAVALCTGVTVLVLCSWPVRAITARVAAWLGQVSYGIYLWHLPVLFLLNRHVALEPLHALLVAVPLTVGLAALTWRWVEAPALRRWGGAKGPARAPGAGRLVEDAGL
jgi:peptidoglycan/LPS O-acetylase OafA/YrhL